MSLALAALSLAGAPPSILWGNQDGPPFSWLQASEGFLSPMETCITFLEKVMTTMLP